jgi:hypothetical protein
MEVREVLEVEMKGVPGKVKLYNVGGIRGDHEAHLQEKDETLVCLTSKIDVLVFGMSEKILEGTGRRASITHASLTSANVLFDDEISQWEDIRMVPTSSSLGDPGIEIYGKVVSVSDAGKRAEALVRFTSVPAQAYKMLRELLRSARSSSRDGEDDGE